MAEEVDVLQVASHLKLVDLVEYRNKDNGRYKSSRDDGSYYQGALTLVPTRKAPRMQNILFKLRHGTESWVIAVRPNRGIISPRDESVTLHVKIRKDGFQENNSEITVQLQSIYWEDEIGSSEQDFNDAWNSLKFKQANIAKNLIRISIQDDENDLYPPSPLVIFQSKMKRVGHPRKKRKLSSRDDNDNEADPQNQGVKVIKFVKTNEIETSLVVKYGCDSCSFSCYDPKIIKIHLTLRWEKHVNPKLIRHELSPKLIRIESREQDYPLKREEAISTLSHFEGK